MIGHVDWEKCQQSYRQFWARENHDKPLVWVTAPEDGIDIHEVVPHQPTQNNLNWITGPYYYDELFKNLPDNLEERWLDSGLIIEKAINNFSKTFYGGVAYPILYPDLGADILGGILGCQYELGEYTNWCKPTINDWESVLDFNLDQKNYWWNIILMMTREMVAASEGRFFVSTADIHPGVDNLVAMRGPDKLCLDLYDNPENVKESILMLGEPFKQIYTQLYELTNNKLSGSSNWMGAWHPGKWHTISADFMVLCSKPMFHEFILPEIVAEANWLDASIFHLDGPDSLKHLDALLQIDELSGLAWLPGAGKPPLSEWIPVLKKIQDHNKVIQAEVFDWEVPIIMSEINPEGVLLITSCETKQNAQDLIRLTEKNH